MLAPIALFAYNRPYHVKKTIESLSNNLLAKDSCIYIYSDGWKNETDKDLVLQVRRYLHEISGFKQISIIEASVNQGLSRSVINGVTEVVNKYGKIIVLEDDLFLSRYFLTFMNEALDKYSTIEEVCNVHGHTFLKSFSDDTFFIRHADSWGWGTWDRAWRYFEEDGAALLKQIEELGLSKQFDFNGSYHFTKMLEDQVNQLNNSWAIRWRASLFLKNKLAINAGHSLVDNIGCDGSGTHCGFTFYPTIFCDKPIRITIPNAIEENQSAYNAHGRYYSFYNRKSIKFLRYCKYLLYKNKWNRYINNGD